MLESGQIRKVANTHYNRPAAADFARGRIQLTDGFFTGNQKGFETGYDTPGERGWILGHEAGHFVQVQTGVLVSDLGDATVRSNPKRILRMFWNQRGQENEELQNDANRYACSVALQPGIWSSNCH